VNFKLKKSALMRFFKFNPKKGN
jgi:hypothetical protein